MVSLLSTTILAGCVWKSGYDALKAQNQQLEEQLAASQQQQATRLLGAAKYVANSDPLFTSASAKKPVTA